MTHGTEAGWRISVFSKLSDSADAADPQVELLVPGPVVHGSESHTVVKTKRYGRFCIRQTRN